MGTVSDILSVLYIVLANFLSRVALQIREYSLRLWRPQYRHVETATNSNDNKATNPNISTSRVSGNNVSGFSMRRLPELIEDENAPPSLSGRIKRRRQGDCQIESEDDDLAPAFLPINSQSKDQKNLSCEYPDVWLRYDKEYGLILNRALEKLEREQPQASTQSNASAHTNGTINGCKTNKSHKSIELEKATARPPSQPGFVENSEAVVR